MPRQLQRAQKAVRRMAKRLPNSQHYAPRRKGWGVSIRAWCAPVFLWEHRRLGFDSPHGAINFKKSYNYGNIIRTMRPAYGVGGA